jgi:hypothetical protein
VRNSIQGTRRNLTYATEDHKVHDLDMNIERSPSKLSPLSNLPLELQELIYGYIFHDYTSDHNCKHFYTRVNNLGCRCGRGLSCVNYFFYNETRARYYQGARFVFQNPDMCQRFLGIGRITKNLGHLSIAYTDNYAESSLLRPIFNDLLFFSCLKSLHLQVNRDGYSGSTFFPLLPIYGAMIDPHPSLKAELYDLSMRPITHPIGGLKFVRKLVVHGQPNHEIEEAVLQLIFNIEKLAKKEGKIVQTECRGQTLFGEWLYEMKIVDETPDSGYRLLDFLF